MNKEIERVKEFSKAFNIHTAEDVSYVGVEVFDLRHKLMAEENDEYLEACKSDDIIGIADALGDQLYILCGTILAHGLQHKIVEVFNEIHRSNMSKLGKDGKPLLREDGKIMKGPDYFKPNIESILYERDSDGEGLLS